jgi:integration host factor subunit beta
MNDYLARSDLIDIMANRFDLHQKESEQAVKAILQIMTDALAKGQRIEIRRFGSFELRKRQPRIARNPKTGKKVSLGVQYNIYFKPGQPLRKKINQSVDLSNQK